MAGPQHVMQIASDKWFILLRVNGCCWKLEHRVLFCAFINVCVKHVCVCVWSYKPHGNSHQFQYTGGLFSLPWNHFRPLFPKTTASAIWGRDKISFRTNMFPWMSLSYLHLQPLWLVDQKGLFNCPVSFSSVWTIFILLNDFSII